MEIISGNPYEEDGNLRTFYSTVSSDEMVWHRDKEERKVTVIEGKLKPPAQKSTPTKQQFIKDFSFRTQEAREAKEVLLDFLTFIKEEGTPIDWVMTMMSLKSSMDSMLKAAAPVKYYYEGSKMSSKELRYEHMLSTEFMVQKLTEHFYIKKIDQMVVLKHNYKKKY